MVSVEQIDRADKVASAGQALLRWYDTHARVLPWRYSSGDTPDPYRVWLSEIMLQQTTVKAVVPYYEKFLDRWPTVHHLASADPDELMRAWAGLGYYARARNLLACARIVSEKWGGVFPDNEIDLKALPGIGVYTSAAIRAIAYNLPAVVVDGNVERVMARMHTGLASGLKSKSILSDFAKHYYSFAAEVGRSGDMAQAFMDLGATVCVPKSPRCGICPLFLHCPSKGKPELLKPSNGGARGVRHKRFGAVYWVIGGDNSVLLEKRQERGLLGGMTGFPVSEWTDKPAQPPSPPEFLAGIPFYRVSRGQVRHRFTHFDLALDIFMARSPFISESLPQNFFWHPTVSLKEAGLPSLFVKVFNLAMPLHLSTG